ncbi:MAG: DUF3048 domain-containing protein, partial [Candidatus Riflebacteria bacterium]|nr:DUF3048 domain-containing protein [Candidatus Riflebacteria bacterium]
LAEAQQEFARILKADPRYHLARYWLSKIQFARGETEQARASARELVKAQPHLRIARELLKEVGADGTPTPEGPAPAKLAQARAPAPTESEEEPQESTKPQERPEGEPEGGLGGGMSGAKGPPSRTMPPGAPVRRHARAASPANGRPVAILVSWKGASSPPAGISGAYLVHEIPVAEQESRLLALFKGTPPASRIGPVAIYDQHLVALARAFGAVVAHLRPPVSSETLPESAATDLIDNRSVPTVFTTDTSGEGRSLVFANPSRLKAELDRRPAVQATAIGFPRLDSPITSGSMPSRLDIQQGYRSAVSFSYDPATGLYHRLSWQGQTAVDGADGSGLAAANVVVITQGTADRWAVEVHRGGTVSSGVLTNDPEAPLTTKKGTPLLLNPGQVWIVGQLAQPARAAAPRRKAASTKAARRAAPKAQPGPAATETPAEEAAPPEVAVSEDPEEPLDSKLYEPKAGGASPSRAEPADETGDDPAPRAKPAATRAKKPQRTAALKDLRAKVRAIAEEVN